ncbi:type II toxin-antitoxin system YafQ family toxin [Helicobacter sp. 11S02596-1]|uniref:type II toxin-antitoxin system YafQ family toxin n=1 Tax=Helicobacter sp. 11S02596-1 TaxID=1476194 RepID=UPI000BA5D5F4|nr:type II toxin-antitoxin system YafQ family toxin [Helicobacter sp. 11S02596-1]PAF43621.1 addiction module toxin RelE [Helicobacter sp. 11S02596-1]
MKYQIEHAKKFAKSIKKLNTQDLQKLFIVVEKLANDEVLEPRYKDHKLKGKYAKYRECHILPDLLLVYQKQEDILVPTCLEVGSHSELF